MIIIHIIPGSGGSFYCGNCLRDSKLFDAIRAEGHDAIKIPMYLPLFAHDTINKEIPVFYGAISIYLKQNFRLFRHAPAWVDKLLNSGPMLRFAASMANSTRATGLEEMTISMLLGEDGQQKDELEKMVHWLETHIKPDVIHISNALLLGLAHKLKERLKVPVVCSLQDEDVWVDDMHPEMAAKVWHLMCEKTKDVDLFIPVSQYFASFIKDRLCIPDEKMEILHLGVDPEDYTFSDASAKARNIGYLSRLCKENGLEVLIDAFILLKKMNGFDDVRLLLTGGYTADDNSFIKKQKKKIHTAGLNDSVEIIHDFEGEARKDFLSRVQLLSVPVLKGEAFGIYLLEAMASGIPVVQPALGAFPEIIEKSGGGVVYPSNTPEELAIALSTLLADQQKISEMSFKARKSTEDVFNIHNLAQKLTTLYQSLDKSTNNETTHANQRYQPL
jgi:glycosyltransferase involved in cell wall biosynthesis